LEREVVYLLTDPEHHPPVWRIADLGRELDYFDPNSLVNPLVQAGPMHRLSDEFVIATPAAYKMVGLTGQRTPRRSISQSQWDRRGPALAPPGRKTRDAARAELGGDQPTSGGAVLSLSDAEV
jgi:hypothetical protein